MRRRSARLVLSGLLLVAAGCGKKGPPLPPIVRIPVAPPDFTAIRRGSEIGITFVVPGANTDGTTPADLSRVEIYALTGVSTLTPDEIIKRGTKVGSLIVNQPRDPDETEEETKRREAARRPEAVEQGQTIAMTESMAFDVSADPADLRSYVAFAFNKRGRRGPFSNRVLVPLTPSPPPPPPPLVAYDETSLTVWWSPAVVPEFDGEPAYHVYESADENPPVQLTGAPLTDSWYSDGRMVWGMERCFTVRTVIVVQTLALQSEPSAAACAALEDTFPPRPPTGLISVAAEGAINLIWNPNQESDLAGYRVLRAIAPDENLTAVNATPVLETTFRDTVPTGARVTYAIQAVDRAGNPSESSERVVETAR